MALSLAGMLALLAMLPLVAAQKPAPAPPAPEKTRGGPSAEQSFAFPLRGSEGGDHVNWNELAAMLAVLGAVVGGIQWLIVRAMIEPAIVRQADAIKVWAKEEFPSAVLVESHLKRDEEYQIRTDHELERMWDAMNRK